ncbi:MAG: hypothetical protein V3T84_16975 [Phycisphaerales bacterium]
MNLLVYKISEHRATLFNINPSVLVMCSVLLPENPAPSIYEYVPCWGQWSILVPLVNEFSRLRHLDHLNEINVFLGNKRAMLHCT